MKPFERIKGRGRAVFILYLSLYSVQDIAKLLSISERTVTRYISKGSEEYPSLRNDEEINDFVTF